MTKSNTVTVKKEQPNAGTDSMINIELASKAMVNFKQLIASGKNANVLNDVANSFVNKKESATVKALRLDMVLKGLESKVFQCQTIVNTRKITQADNYFDYVKFIKQVMSKKVELNDNQKGQVKTIVATAQVLRQGALAKYVHNEISWVQLQQHYRIEEKAPESVTESETGTAPDTAPTESESNAINMEVFKSMVDTIQTFEDAELAFELIKAKMEALATAQAETKAA